MHRHFVLTVICHSKCAELSQSHNPVPQTHNTTLTARRTHHGHAGVHMHCVLMCQCCFKINRKCFPVERTRLDKKNHSKNRHFVECCLCVFAVFDLTLMLLKRIYMYCECMCLGTWWPISIGHILINTMPTT